MPFVCYMSQYPISPSWRASTGSVVVGEVADHSLQSEFHAPAVPASTATGRQPSTAVFVVPSAVAPAGVGLARCHIT